MEMKETLYRSPRVRVIDMQTESIICASDQDVTVSNAFEGNTEEVWE